MFKGRLEGRGFIPHPTPSLQQARDITQANGLRRAACDDAHNLYTAAMRTRSMPLPECVVGLRAALKDAQTIGYRDGRVRLGTALALAFLGGCDPGAPLAGSASADAATGTAIMMASAATAADVREPQVGTEAAYCEAEALLAQALELTAPCSVDRANVLSVLTLRHLLREDEQGAAAAVQTARDARYNAQQAAAAADAVAAGLNGGAGGHAGSCEQVARAADDANLGVALLMLCAQGGAGGHGDVPQMQAEAVALLEGATAAADSLLGGTADASAPRVATSPFAWRVPSTISDTCAAGVKACRALSCLRSAAGRREEASAWAAAGDRLQRRLWSLSSPSAGADAGSEGESQWSSAPGGVSGSDSRAKVLAAEVEKLSLAWEAAQC
jgi:hypothetical protein